MKYDNKMKMNFFIILLFSFYQGYSQRNVKIYFDQSWNIVGQDEANYYRILDLDTINYTINGNFSDYTMNNVKILSGVYNNGIKEGDFEFYDTSAMKYCEGSFSKNLPTGIWKYYHSDGKIKCIVQFEEGDFQIRNFFDKNGKELLPDGTGELKFDFISNFGFYSDQKIFIKYENLSPVDKWAIMDGDTVIVTENYKKGKLKSVTNYFNDIKSSKIKRTIIGLNYDFNDLLINEYNLKPITLSLFFPTRLFKAETFNFMPNVTYDDYPFIPSLPKWEEISAIGILNDSAIHFLDHKPEYPGGMSKLMTDLLPRMRYPREAQEKGMKGKIYVEVVLDEKGRIFSAKSTPQKKKPLEDEAERIFEDFYLFKPGIHNGKPIKTKFFIPITFNL